MPWKVENLPQSTGDKHPFEPVFIGIPDQFKDESDPRIGIGDVAKKGKSPANENKPRIVEGPKIPIALPDYGCVDAKDWVNEILGEINKLESRGLFDITIEFETEYGYYDEVSNYLNLKSKRLETEKEVEKRVAAAEKKRAKDRKDRANAKIKKEEEERNEYLRLRAKYGNQYSGTD